MGKMISKHISYKEATKSDSAIRLGIKNIPSESVLNKMISVAENVFEPLRKWYGKPISITSFYRSSQLNIAIGGSVTSQHCKGEAIDIDTDRDNAKIFHFIKDNLDFDQLIWEFGDKTSPDWVHVSYSNKNRKEILVAKKKSGRTIYVKYENNI